MLGTSPHKAVLLVTGEGEEEGKENGEGRERKGNEGLVSAPGGGVSDQGAGGGHQGPAHQEAPTPESHSGPQGTVSTRTACCVCVCVVCVKDVSSI